MRFVLVTVLSCSALLGPSLMASSGVRLLAGGLAQAQTAAPPAAGEVSFIAGAVQVRATGASRTLKVGDTVYQGDTFETGASGHLHIKTVDKGFLALRPSSRAQIELYEFDPGAPTATRIRLKLDAGVMRAVSGEGAQAARQNFRLNTPVAAIGIRGTDFSVSTSDVLTRAVVRSGAIVIASFDGDCRADALGPCRGDAARQLSGDQVGKLLELRRGQREPALLDIRNGSGAPDQTAPPNPAEPRSSLPADKLGVGAAQSGAAVAEASLSAALNAARAESAAPEAAPVAAVVAPPAPPAVVNWGRWQSLAGTGGTVSVDDFVARNGNPIAINRLYILAGSGAENLRLPAAGEFSFKLDSFDAYLTNSAGGSPVPASLQRGDLTVDFGRSRFSTSLDITALSTAYQLRAQGQLTADGGLFGNIAHTDGFTNTAVRGALSGTQGERAAYLFDYGIDAKRAIVGAAGWQR